MKYLLPVFLLICLAVCPAWAQNFHRIKADFSIKEMAPDGKTLLTLGTVYYDKSARQLVYQIRFPEAETWVVKDTVFYRFAGQKLTQRKKTFAMTETSIFHMSLHGSLPDYGLKNSSYKVVKVEKENNLVLTTWEPPTSFARSIGKIILSQQDKKLQGLAFFDPKNNLVSRQIFRNYVQEGGLSFPSEIIQITARGTEETTRLTTYTNVKVNDLQEDQLYHYPLPR